MRFASIAAVCTAAMALMGCPVKKAPPPDTDASPTMQAPRIPPDLDVDDSVDGQDDKTDWKIVQPTVGGSATVKVSFPAGHQVVGAMGVYGTDGATAVEEVAINADETDYSITWDVAKSAIYYVKIAATTGKSAYNASFSVTEPEPVDPCAGVECGEDQECQEGTCVEVVPPDCDPKCRGGMVCVNGTCEKPCGGGCPKGELCSRRTNQCYKDPCYQKQCGAGEKCVYGVCKPTEKPPAEIECKPACTGGAKCNTKTGKCEGGGTTVEEPPKEDCSGPLNGSIVQVLPQGPKTVLVINRGSKVCVKVGQTGKIAGVNGVFKITEVYEFRSKAVIEVDDKVVGANRSVTINR